MDVVTWSQSVKNDLVRMQSEVGIPALWAAAQMCHESASDGGRSLSQLATKSNNYAGLKWAGWQAEHGCQPVSYGTWEVLNGQRVDLTDAFCSCPSWDVWLKVYADLLTSSLYRPALAYARDPMLYGWQVWRCGWATDPNYMVGVGGWMARIFDIYQDSIPALSDASRPQPVKVLDTTGSVLCEGWVQNDQTVAPIRNLAQGLGMNVIWNEADRSVTVTKG